MGDSLCEAQALTNPGLKLSVSFGLPTGLLAWGQRLSCRGTLFDGNLSPSEQVLLKFNNISWLGKYFKHQGGGARLEAYLLHAFT